MNETSIQRLVSEWDTVYKKGQLSLWVLLAVADGRKYAAQISQFMSEATNGTFDVKEQSLYRALRRFEAMKLVISTKEDSPVSGTRRNYFTLTAGGREVLGRFLELHIQPLYTPNVQELINQIVVQQGE